MARASSIRPPAVGSPEDVAYVIHTSGSTGAPKGIAVQHAPAVQLVDWVNRTFGVGPGDRLLFITSLCFDLSVYDIFGTLAAGGTVHIASEAALREPAELVRLLSEEPITIWDSAPAALQQLAPLFPAGERRALRLVLLSGDWIPVPLPDEVRAAFPGARVVSLGGATEATVWSNWYPIGAVDPRWPSIPYGRPIANARYHVLDAGLSPCPIGVPGDLSIGGSCLCVGYAGQPELTAAAFVPDPFAAEPGARLYRTGDRARFFRDGNLEFLGRADQQVKVRGYRIELGEIEAVLLRHAAVREAVAMAWEGSLVAYVVLDRTDPTDRFDPTDPKSALAAWLGARLPQYMLPSSFVLLDAMPVTANGKLDRKALPAPEWGGEEGSYEAPSDPVEETLVHLWTELLGRERVGVRESFFTLGGHSLLATQLMSRLRGALGVELALRELFEAPTIAELARTVRRARREEAAPAPPPLVPVPRDGAQEGLPLSFAQQRLWLIDQLEPGNPAYNVPLAVRLTGEVAPALVERIFAEVVRRHEALRTMFASREGQPVQVVAPPEPAPRLPLIDLSGLAREAEVRTLLREEARRPFDLQRGPLLRLRLVRLAPAEHLLMITLHHIVADAWSMGVLLREVAALYAAFSQGRPSPLPALPVQYADFAVWQRSWLQGAALEAQLAYWRRQLAGAPAVLELPLDRPRPAVQTFRGAARPIALPPALSEGVRELGRSEGATPFMVLLAAWAVLLGRHAGQEDVVLGTPIAGRNRRELEDLIGFFVNTLALRTDLAGEPAFSELLGRVRATVLDAFAHQDLPFERLVEELVPERDLSRSPLFQTLFALQNAPAGALAIPGLSLQPVAVDSGSAKLDLTLSLREGPAGFAGTLEHNADLFDGATAERLLARFAVLLEGAVAEPGRALHDLPLLPPAEREQVLREHNATRRDYPREAGLAELFAQMARRLPDAPAVIAAPAAGGEVWSYRRLDEASDGLAQRLRSLGVRSEAAVGISMERSPELILGTLAIVKAGGTYVPLDAGYPDERLAFMLADTGARIVLVDERARERMAALAQALVVVDSRASLSLPSSEPLPSFAPPPDSLAYVIYTSGSTGTPKGVAVPQRAIVRLVRETDYAQLGRGDRVAHLSNTSFDAATFEIWGALLNGAAVVVIPREVALAPAELAALLRRQGVTAIFLTTALFNQVAREAPDAFFTVRHVLFGGEAVDPGAAARVLERGGPERLLHVYGPTESTTFATWHLLRAVPPGAATLPIGLPVANTTACVLDPWQRPVPLGVTGELFLGGDGLARGYLNRPDLTAERFVPHPWPHPGRSGERLYRTGDLVRQRPEGSIEFLGRRDDQVKIRGFRIEPGEIEAVLGGHPAVRERVVVVREGVAGLRSLAAYVVLQPESRLERPGAALRAWLEERLPDYMIPAAFVLLDALPLTPNGKVDRGALPAPELSREEERPAAPADPVEELLAGIWAEVLGRERVGVHDDFFALGGYSLLATQVMSRVREVLGVELPLRRLFESSTVAELARDVREAREAREAGSPAPPITPVPRDRDLPLSFAQQRLWLIDQLDPGGSLYNLPLALRLTGEVAPALLERLFAEIVRRHEALRTTFDFRGGQPVQVIAPPEPAPQLPLIDLSGLRNRSDPADLEAREATALALARAEACRPFDLRRRPLLRLALLRLDASDHLLLLTLHHIVSDGWSMGVLVREIAALHAAFSRGLPSPLPALPVQYADFAVWQRSWLRGAVLDAQLDLWRRRLAGAPRLLELPTDRPRPAAQTFRGATRPIALSAALAEGVREVCRRESMTPFMVLLAAWALLLGRLAGQDEVVLGTPIAGRNRREIEDLIGFFINTLALRIELFPSRSQPKEPSFRELLGRVRETALEAFALQDVPFERLVEELVVERDLACSPLFQVLFALQNAPAAALTIPGLSLAPVAVDSGTAKFDLALSLTEVPAGFAGFLQHNTDLFEDATAERLLARFAALLEAAVADPGCTLPDLPLLLPPERHQMLREWNDIAEVDSPGVLLHDLLATQAAKTPDSVVAVLAGEALSYRELDRRAHRLARRLIDLGVAPDGPISLLADPDPQALIGMLGILKAGCGFVPIDPRHPDERLAWTLEDCDCAVLVTQRRHLKRAEALARAAGGLRHIVCLEDVLPSGPPRSGRGRDPGELRSLAYVVYTSGSTGRPKGVQVVHESLVPMLVWGCAYFGLGAHTRVLQSLSFCFDFGIFEQLTTVLAGGTLVFPGEAAGDPAAYAREIVRSGINTLHTTPAFARELAAAGLGLESLEILHLGGEALSWETVARLCEAAPRATVYNGYGPTEATINSSIFRLGRAQGGGGAVVPIGRRSADNALYVLDRAGRLSPLGARGELHVGGIGVARGYLNRPELTAERFVPHPWPQPGKSGERLYRTGDLARHRPDGSVELHGRLDDQVKIRGFRIEPGEIEAALASHPQVAECAVLARRDDPQAPGDVRLVAYVVLDPTDRTDPTDPQSALSSWLREKLPDYMVPSAFVSLEALPLTPNGKLDRKALPAPGGDARAYVAPSDPVEEKLAAVWAEVLRLDRVGINDDFFALGGHSLLATQVVSRVREELGVELPLRRLFTEPTIRQLARGLVPSLAAPARNVSLALRLSGELAVAALENAFMELVRRHPALRTTLALQAGRPVQGIAPPETVRLELPLLDLSDAPEEAREEWARELALEEARSPFDLQRGPLLRLGLLRLSEREHLLLVTLHPIVADGWSEDVLLREIGALSGFAGTVLPEPEATPEAPSATAREGISEGISDGILATIGRTPLIRLRRFLPTARFELFAKLEALNPGGSIKDRPALAILEDALDSGAIGPQTLVIESSSGNMGIGLAQACRYHGLRFLCVVDPKTERANLRILRAYGAEIELVEEPDPVSGEFLPARLDRVRQLIARNPNAFWPDQYANLKNPGSHYETTMREVATALGGRVDFLFVATSTCGTVRGCAEYLRDHGLSTRVVAVDAVGSLIFSDVRAKRLVPGLGAGLRPPLCDISLIDECVHVTDLDCVVGCRRLVAREAILAGGSSGGVLSAVEKLKDRIPEGAVCVAILPDRGERYLETVFSDEWVREHFGDAEHLWSEDSGALHAWRRRPTDPQR
ncbi:MAG TPA: 2,3-diaminopropionate biosynthesis protein SbnA [Thermoanaerobaculia bacterium]|nr:2,3-diaminopropionate biosynthesis protein SbnA [Thermoanaerobaculia bacterium]